MRGLLWQVRQEMSFFTESWGANKGLGEATKAARGRSMKARATQSRKGVKGQLPLAGSRDSVPCGVWGNAPTVPRATSILNTLNKGAGSEASLPVTLRVRRRAPKLLFPPRFRDEQKCRTLCTTLCITKENGQYQQTYPQNRAKNADLVNSVCITDEKLPKDTG